MKKGFALIYAMILSAILLFVVSGIAIALSNSMKLNRSSRNSIQAYSLARSALDDVWTQYKESPDEFPKFPNGACLSDGEKNFSTGNLEIVKSDLINWLSELTPTEKVDGVSVYSACGTSKEIYTIGYFGGQKHALKAIITPKEPLPELHQFTYPVVGFDDAVDNCIVGDYPGSYQLCDDNQNYQIKKTDTIIAYSHRLDTIKVFQTNL